MKSLIGTFGLSVAAHFLLLLAGVYFLKFSDRHLEALPPHMMTRIMTPESLDGLSSSASSRKEKKVRHISPKFIRGNGKTSKSDISRLFQISSAHSIKPIIQQSGSGYLIYGSGAGKNLKYDGATGSGQIYSALPSAGWLNALYQRMDENLNYPSELADAGIQGDVLVELRFRLATPGKAEISRVNSTSPYLRVVVMRSLKRVLPDPLPKDLMQMSQDQNVSAHFTFQITEPQSEVYVKEQQMRVGRKFVFYRNEVRSKLEWKLGPLSGLYGLPSVGISPTWFVEKTDEYIYRRTKADPLESYRRDPEFQGS